MDLAALARALAPPAHEAGAKILAMRGQDVQARRKADGAPVSLADTEAEAILLEALEALAPDIPVVAEEDAQSHEIEAERFFLVDALDGSKEYLRPGGGGAFTVNIGLVEAGEPVMGVVFAPALERFFWGAKGAGAHEFYGLESGGRRQGEAALFVRPQPDKGPVAAVSSSHLTPATERWLRDNGVARRIAIGSSLKFCLLAAGEADLYPRFAPTMEWDTAAGDAILRAAGGITETPSGAVFRYGKPGYRNGDFVARAGAPRGA